MCGPRGFGSREPRGGRSVQGSRGGAYQGEGVGVARGKGEGVGGMKRECDRQLSGKRNLIYLGGLMFCEPYISQYSLSSRSIETTI